MLNYIAKKLRRYEESEQAKLDRFYMIRKKVADKRLRVKGRFVTNDQALKLLGLTHEELQASTELQQFFNDQASVQFQLDSIFQA